MKELNSLIENLQSTCKEIRKLTIEALYQAKSGHAGPSLSIVEILAVLFHNELKLAGNDRDRLILSKGHGVPSLYAAMASVGWIEHEELMTLRQIGSRLQGHPDMTKLPLLDCGSGALGQGASVAIGYALAAKLRKSDSRVYCILGDGECQEGQIWEAAMFAAAQGLDNLVFILDANGHQNEDLVEKTLPMGNHAAKWKEFGWNCLEIEGHQIDQILAALNQAHQVKHKPTMIVAKTVKGKGVPFMEDNSAWHSKVVDTESYNKAMQALQ